MLRNVINLSQKYLYKAKASHYLPFIKNKLVFISVH